MKQVIMCGLSPDERTFFKQALSNGGAELDFVHQLSSHVTLDPNTEVLSVFVDTEVTRQVIDNLPNLKLIACRSTGTNNVDAVAAKERGITVANVPSYGSSAVAEYTFALMIMLTRRMLKVVDQSNAVYPGSPEEQGTDLFGKTLGIVGTGKIGLSVARIAKGFGMSVLGVDKYPRPEEAANIGFDYVELDELLARSDIVTLHAPYVPENHHLLSSERLARMKPGAYLINTARGELVDTTALVRALIDNKLGGAGLDVVEGEELLDPQELVLLASKTNADPELAHRALSIAALQRLPNVILTNHNAYNSREAVRIINQTTVDTIRDFCADKK